MTRKEGRAQSGPGHGKGRAVPPGRASASEAPARTPGRRRPGETRITTSLRAGPGGLGAGVDLVSSEPRTVGPGNLPVNRDSESTYHDHDDRDRDSTST